MTHRSIVTLAFVGAMLVSFTPAQAATKWTQLSQQFVKQAVIQARAKDYPAAIDLLEQALVADPKNARAFIWRGRIAFAQKQDEIGINAIATGLNIEPAHKSARLWLGRAYLRADDMKNAQKQLEQLRVLCRDCTEMKKLAAAIEAAQNAETKASVENN